jgi:hypothetical protein
MTQRDDETLDPEAKARIAGDRSGRALITSIVTGLRARWTLARPGSWGQAGGGSRT